MTTKVFYYTRVINVAVTADSAEDKLEEIDKNSRTNPSLLI